MVCRTRRWHVLLSAVLCVAAAGCGDDGEQTVVVRGKLTNAGRPLQVEGSDLGLGMVLVRLYRVADDGQQSTDPEEAAVDAEGNFEVPGRTGNGLPPGKYRIVVRQWDPYPRVDRLGGRFDEQNSRIIREITGEEDLTIDVSSPQG